MARQEREGMDEGLARARARICPACATEGLISGPRGGASRNFYRGACGQGWNLHGIDRGVFAVGPIGAVDPDLVAAYRDGRLPPRMPQG